MRASAVADLGLRMRSASVGLAAAAPGQRPAGRQGHRFAFRRHALPRPAINGSRLAAARHFFEQGGAYAIADANASGGTLHALFMHESQSGASRYDRLLGGEGLFSSGFDPQSLDFGVARYANPEIGPERRHLRDVLAESSGGRTIRAEPAVDTTRSAVRDHNALGYQLQANHDFCRATG